MSGPGPGEPEQALTALGVLLAERVAAAVPGWARARVDRLLHAWEGAGGQLGAAGGRDLVMSRAEEAGRQAAGVVAVRLQALAVADVDVQRTTPLEVVRSAVVPGLTAVLAEAGVPPVVRDRFLEERFPDDPYGLTPPSLAAIDPALGELGATWGAAKAAAHLARRGRGRPPA